MTQIIAVGDIHAMDRAPRNATETYMSDIIDMLRWIAEEGARRKVDAVVWAGDIFHHKQPSKTSHALILRMIEVVRYYQELGVDLYAVTGNHDMCVSDDTEALTDQGWKLRTALNGSERFATLNPETQVFEWQTPSRVHAQPFAGELLHFSTRAIDQLVTPNHDLFVSTLGGAKWKKRKAKDAPNYRNWTLPAQTGWVGETPQRVTIPEVERPFKGRADRSEYILSPEDAAALFGWYVSEGSSELGRATISQSVAANPQHYDTIQALLERIGVPFTAVPKAFRINSASVELFLSESFGASSYEKRVPAWLKEWNPRLLGIFLQAYWDGDATPNGPGWTARTASDQLADDLQEIAIKAGWTATIRPRETFPVKGTPYVGTAMSMGFGNSKRALTLPPAQEVPYAGTVWCPTLPNGIWLSRRNGKASWTGNSNDVLQSIPEKQPLGVLYEAGLKELVGWHERLPLFGIPWRHDWTTSESSADRSFFEWRVDPWRFGTAGETAECLAVTHAPIYPPKEAENIQWELVPTMGENGISAAMGNQGYLYYGHIHEDHGVFEVEGVTYANMGAISRGSLTEYNIQRQIKVAAWKPESGFEEIVVPHKPASEVLRVAEVAVEKAEKRSLDTFLAEVGSSTLDISNTGSVVAYIRGRKDVDTKVRKTAIEILEEVNG